MTKEDGVQMTNNCIMHGDAWCSCCPEKEPDPDKIRANAQKLAEIIKAMVDEKKGNEIEDGNTNG